MMIDTGPNFILQELVPPQIYHAYGEYSLWFLDPVALRILLFMRARYGKTYVNNWVWGGNRDEAGFRLPTTETGATYSQHKMGRAFDPQFENFSADEVREDIHENERMYMAMGLTTLESAEYAPTWVHFDTRATNLDHLLIVEP